MTQFHNGAKLFEKFLIKKSNFGVDGKKKKISFLKKYDFTWNVQITNVFVWK